MDFAEFFGCEWMDFGGGRYRGGIFGRGDLKFMVLRVLADRPMHGYDVMRALETESKGCYKASPGSVYPTLQMLEDEGYLVSKKEGGKKVYSVTSKASASSRSTMRECRRSMSASTTRRIAFSGRTWRTS